MPRISLSSRTVCYKSGFSTLFLVGLLIVTTGFVIHSSQSNGGQQNADIRLPIEVMHGDVFGEYPGNEALPFHGGNSPRYVKSVTFEVSSGGGELWLWGHHIGFQYFGDWFAWDTGQGNFHHPVSSSYNAPFDGRAKAAVRINGGDWIDLTNDIVTCATTEEAQGCIGGIASSARFKVNGTELRTGTNSVDFAFLGHDMLTSGYRILDMGALPPGYGGSLSHRDVRTIDQISTPKVETDPVEWSEPGDSNVSRGRDLWHNAELIEWPGSGTINATCNACHAEGGRDLKFFNYSNESIIARSEHHGLSEQEGRDIAAYIRSQMLRMADGTTYEAPGRPWNPPYQPGPRGFGPHDEHPDEAPAQYWSAGAGLEWVADAEKDILPYVFPDGSANHDSGPFKSPGAPDYSLARYVMRVDGPRMNTREIPLSIQLPDWNRWLPIIHPMDAFGEEYYLDREYEQYLKAREEIPVRRDRNDLNGMSNRITWTLAGMKKEFHHANAINPTKWNSYYPRTSRGALQWRSVKAWEFHHEFDLSGWFRQVDGKADPTRYEARSWGGTQRSVFDIASHIAGDTEHMDGPSAPLKSQGLTHLWYQLQLVLHSTAGHSTGGTRPQDWSYQRMFLAAHNANTRLPAYTRWITSTSKMTESLPNWNGLDSRSGWGADLFNLQALYSFAMSEQYAKAMPGNEANLFIDSYLDAFYYSLRDLEHRFIEIGPWDDFARGTDSYHYWGMPGDVPKHTTPRHGPQSVSQAANNFYNSLRIFNEVYNLTPSVVGNLAQWGSKMWADPPSDHVQWHEFEALATGPPAGSESSNEPSPSVVVELDAPNEDVSVHVNGDYTVAAEVSIESDITLTRLAVYVDDVLLDETDATELSTKWVPEESGEVQLLALAQTGDSSETKSFPITVTVEPEPLIVHDNSAFPNQVLALDPVEYWRFQENSGTTSSGELRAFDAELTNSPVLDTPGKIGSSIEFLSDDQSFAEAPYHESQDMTGSLTLTFWFNVSDGWPDDYWTHLIGKGDDTYQVRRNSNDQRLSFDVRGGSGEDVKLVTDFETHPDTWYHIAAIYDADDEEMRVFVNGAQDSNTAQRSGTVGTNQQGIQFGANQSPDGTYRRFFNGKMDEVAVFDRALSSAEVEDLFESTYEELDPNALIPSLIVHKPAEVGESEATLKGEIGAMGSSQVIDVWFEYKVTDASTWMQTSPEALAPGDTMAIPVTDLSEGTSYDYRLVSEVDGAEVSSATESFVTINAPEIVSHQLQLNEGWNLISSWVTPEADLIEDVLEDILSNVVLVKNGKGETFIPQYDINDIQEWDPAASYMIFMLNDDHIEVTGTRIDIATQFFNLDAGWNQIGYPLSNSMAPSVAFESISSDIILVKDYAGEAYLPAYDIDDIGQLQPGQGYRVFAKKAVSLEFPAMDVASVESSLVASTETNISIASPSTAPRRGVSTSATLILESGNLPAGSTIEAVTSSNEVVGITLVQGGHSAIRIKGTDERESTGVQPGETLSLRMRSDDDEKQKLTIEHIEAVVGGVSSTTELTYLDDGVFLVKAQPGPSELILKGSYPNPVEQQATIEYGLPEDSSVRIAIFDMLGRRVSVLVDEHQQAGFHEVKMYAQDLASGVYVYRITTDFGSATERFTVVR